MYPVLLSASLMYYCIAVHNVGWIQLLLLGIFLLQLIRTCIAADILHDFHIFVVASIWQLNIPAFVR